MGLTRGGRWTAAAVLAAACGGEGDAGPARIEVGPEGIQVRGVPPPVLRGLSRLAPNDSVWRHVVSVFVEPRTESTPAVIGTHDVDEGRIRFRPRFPFTPGTSYQARFDAAVAARLTGGGDARAASIEHRFSIPMPEERRTTRVIAVHPSNDRIPENILRWYVEFSGPMSVGDALANVKLLDEAGREVRNAFLSMDQELWDPERRRLTLLFDPGRVKRGIRTNLEAGPPLVAGRRYRLVIDADWRDGGGARLASGFQMDFDAAPADRRSPDPSSWMVTSPRAGSREPLRVDFGESIDHALASRAIAVGRLAEAIRGVATLGDGDSAWSFVPDEPWVGGAHELRVAALLEDVAGNNLVRVFDADRGAGAPAVEATAAGSRVRSRKFVVR
jgi:hypothetical protein